MRLGLLKKIINMFFNELNETLSKAVNSYENIIVIEDLNIDVSDHNKDRINYLSDFVDTFSLYNLVKHWRFVQSFQGFFCETKNKVTEKTRDKR